MEEAEAATCGTDLHFSMVTERQFYVVINSTRTEDGAARGHHAGSPNVQSKRPIKAAALASP